MPGGRRTESDVVTAVAVDMLAPAEALATVVEAMVVTAETEAAMDLSCGLGAGAGKQRVPDATAVLGN